MLQHEEEDASIRRDHEGAMGAGEAAMRRIEELNRRANEAGAADVAEWENLRADYSWALEEVRRVMEASDDMLCFLGFDSFCTIDKYRAGLPAYSDTGYSDTL